MRSGAEHGRDLSHNVIAELSPTLFWQLTELHYVDLSSNRITLLASTQFTNNTLVTKFFLAHNRIAAIADDSFPIQSPPPELACDIYVLSVSY